MKKIKIYVHHYFNDLLFYKLAHNTTDRVYKIKNLKGVVFCKYKNSEIELIFDNEINYNTDGFHLLDWYTSLTQRHIDKKFDWENVEHSKNELLPYIKGCNQLLKNEKDWIILCLRTEKLHAKNDNITDITSDSVKLLIETETELEKLNNHKIISDNVFLNDVVATRYPNNYFTLSNTIFQWNEMIGIIWYNEFKKIYDKLNFEYDLMYSVRNHKSNRIAILYELNKLNNPKILLQRTNSFIGNEMFYNSPSIQNIKLNNIFGSSDFENISAIKWDYDVLGLDLFFRVLSQSKMQILCESWSWSNKEFTSQYLSEKTIGLILAGIPFISTHSYPIDILQKILNIKEHPFYNQIKYCNGSAQKFAVFVKEFMENFDINYELCKSWSDDCLDKLLKKIKTENDLLELILSNFSKSNVVKQNLI